MGKELKEILFSINVLSDDLCSNNPITDEDKEYIYSTISTTIMELKKFCDTYGKKPEISASLMTLFS